MQQHHLVIRTRSRIRKRLWLILPVAVLVTAVIFLVRPHRWFGRPDLQLVALDDNGLFQDSVDLPRAWADTTYKGAYGATARVPLVLGVRNVGEVETTARSLSLSLPARYRLQTGQGRELPHETTPGNPLIRYVLNGPFPPVQPGRLPTVLASTDTLWLEPVVPQLYCIVVGDSVPEFIPAAQPNAQSLSHVAIFYSFDNGARRGRQAGLLSVRLDPSIVERPAAPPLPVYQTSIKEPAWPMPPLGPLHRVAMTTPRCGPPEAPIELSSTIWQGESGGRVYVLTYGGKPRKYLFDLNGDGVVDLEMWDASGTGRFDAQRAAHFPVPAFLLPPPGPPPFNPAVFSELSPDSLARLRVFASAGTYDASSGQAGAPGGPFRGAGVFIPRGPRPTVPTKGVIDAAGRAPARPVGPGAFPAPGGVGGAVAPAAPTRVPGAAPAPAGGPAGFSAGARPPAAQSAAPTHSAFRRRIHLLGRPVRLPSTHRR